MDRTKAIGLLGSAVQLVLAALLGAIASRPGAFPSPPEPIPRGLALGLLYALPAIVGAIGAIGGRRSLLAAAAALSSVGSILAFSGVTLVFLVPALVFAAAMGATSRDKPPARPAWQGVVLLAVLSAAMVVAVLRLGIFVLPPFVLLLLALHVGRGLRREEAAAGSALTGAALAVGVVGLGLGAGWAILSMTETRCWTAYQTPDGIEYQTGPGSESGTLTLGREGIAGGCDSGVPTVPGAITASALALGAVALAAVSGRPRRSGPADAT